jgi:arsenate reductase
MKGGRTLLFVCHYNSARSQLAEALAKPLAPPDTRILSGGLVPSTVNGEVLAALREIGIDASAQRSKAIAELSAEPVDEVFLLCPEAGAPAARLFPDAVHHDWPMEDPIALQDPAGVPGAVRRARDELAGRLKSWFEEIRCR